MRGAETVCTGVATTDDDYAFARGGDRLFERVRKSLISLTVTCWRAAGILAPANDQAIGAGKR